MIKKFLLVLAFLCFSSIHAQYVWTPAKVILKNGTSFRGLVKFPKHSGGLLSIGSTKFKYKKNKKAKAIKYGSDTVDEIVFGDENYATVNYKYVPIGKKRLVLMELEIRGKVSLYSRIVSNVTSIPEFNPNIRDEIVYYDDRQFYLKRDNEEEAKLFIGSDFFLDCKSRAKKYFSDCSKIVKYIDHDLYDLDELNGLLELVDDYNLFCE